MALFDFLKGDFLKGEDAGPNRFLFYLLCWVAVIGAFVLLVFEHIEEWMGLLTVGVLVVIYILVIILVFHPRGYFTD